MVGDVVSGDEWPERMVGDVVSGDEWCVAASTTYTLWLDRIMYTLRTITLVV